MGFAARRATVFVGETYGDNEGATAPLIWEEAAPEMPAATEVLAGSFASPPMEIGCWFEGLLCVKNHARTMAPAMQIRRQMPTNQTQRERRVEPF